MQEFKTTFEVRWADIDANRHMRHSAYYDYAAHLRVQILEAIGMDVDTLSKLHIGPILFREEAVFKRELGMSEKISVNVMLKRSRHDGSRWTFVHEITREDGNLAATISVDGAWIDIQKRKIVGLPEEFLAALKDLPKTGDFAYEEDEKKP
ncbi:MAG: thioesterase family protein [Gammaproteobacteria bacterium]|nr:thioesterase family protein [Gammaproteobacteria bacterium]